MLIYNVFFFFVLQELLPRQLERFWLHHRLGEFVGLCSVADPGNTSIIILINNKTLSDFGDSGILKFRARIYSYKEKYRKVQGEESYRRMAWGRNYLRMEEQNIACLYFFLSVVQTIFLTWKKTVNTGLFCEKNEQKRAQNCTWI